MTNVNVMLSIERKLQALTEKSAYASEDPFRRSAYELGACESMLTCVLHDVFSRYGEEVMIDMMKRVCINPVFSS